MPVAPEEGRIGDVWRAEGEAHEMFVDRLNQYTITLKSVSEPNILGGGLSSKNGKPLLPNPRGCIRHRYR